MEPASDLLILICLAFVGVAGTIIVNLLSNELYDGIPRIAAWLIRRAASRLPGETRDRYLEEWLAHASECKGKLEALLHAIGCCLSVFKMERIATAITGFRIMSPNGDLIFSEDLDEPTMLWMLETMEGLGALPSELQELRTELAKVARSEDRDISVVSRLHEAMKKATPSDPAPPHE